MAHGLNGHVRRMDLRAEPWARQNMSKPLTHLVEAQKHAEEPERLRNHSDASSMRTHVHSDRIDTKLTVAIVESISTLPNRPKTPNSPIGTNGRCIDEVDGEGDIADGSIECRDVQSHEIDVKATEIASRNVKMSNEVEDVKLTSRAHYRSGQASQQMETRQR